MFRHMAESLARRGGPERHNQLPDSLLGAAEADLARRQSSPLERSRDELGPGTRSCVDDDVRGAISLTERPALPVERQGERALRIFELEPPGTRAWRPGRSCIERDREPGHEVLRMRGLFRLEWVALVLEPPRDERFENRRQVATLLCELIPDIAPAGLLVPAHDSVTLELTQADREPLRGHVREQAPKIAETARPGEQVADDQERPA